MFRSELSRAFGNKIFLVAVLAGTCSIVYNFLDSWHWFQLAKANPQFGYHPYHFNAYEVFLASLDLFVLFAILGASSCYADSLVADRDSGYMRYAIFRGGYWRYLVSKLMANWLVGGTVVALSMVFAFCIALLLFTRHLPPLYDAEGVQLSMKGVPHSPLGFIFESNPILYILGRIGLGFLFGGAMATVGFAVSCLSKNRYVVIAIPFITFIVLSLVVHLLTLYGFIPDTMLIPEANSNSSAITMLINYLLFYGGSLLIAFIKLGKLVADGNKLG